MGISGWWFVARGYGFGLPSLGFVTAGLLILLGIAGITSALQRRNDTRHERPTPMLGA